MGNDKALPVKHTGTVTIQTALCPLNDVLHVPDLKKNLLSISQFTRDHSLIQLVLLSLTETMED